MFLRLPVTGLQLKFKHKYIRALLDELAQHDRDINDLSKDVWLTATRLLQVGREWERPITLEEADEIIDQEKEGGVDFDALVQALIKAFRGKPATLTIHAADEEDAPAAAAEADESPKKSDLLLPRMHALGRVS